MLTCRPRFVLWTAVLRQLPLQLFLTIWAGLFFGGFLSFFGTVVAMTRTRGDPGAIMAAMFAGLILLTLAGVTIGETLTRLISG